MADSYTPDGYDEVESKLGPSWPSDETKAGDEVKGTLKELRPSEYGKDNFVLDKASINGKAVEEDGDPCDLLVWGSAVLNNRLAGVETGTDIAIRFDGTELPKVKGQNPMKMFSVAIKK